MLKHNKTGAVYCTKHPKYKVIRKPSSQCEECWYIWVDKNKARLIP